MSPIPKPLLCYVTDRRALRANEEADRTGAVLDCIARAGKAGIDWIQVREKDLPTRALVELVTAAVKSTAKFSSRIIVNDRLDVALAAGAAGVHLGGASLPVAEVVRWKKASVHEGRVSDAFLIGASCHSLEVARAAERDGADYAIFGPVFETPSKAAYGPPLGLDRLAEICRSVRVPVLAIGGITIENAASCLAAGAAGLAAIRMFQEPADAEEFADVVSRLRS